jgi:hypothetical protein
VHDFRASKYFRNVQESENLCRVGFNLIQKVKGSLIYQQIRALSPEVAVCLDDIERQLKVHYVPQVPRQTVVQLPVAQPGFMPGFALDRAAAANSGSAAATTVAKERKVKIKEEQKSSKPEDPVPEAATAANDEQAKAKRRKKDTK